MNVKIIDYTPNGIHKIATLARSTHKNHLSNDYYKDEDFVKSLIEVGHYGVLEHISFTFHISEVSRILTHQLCRHRMASYLQQSDRHVEPTEDGYIVPPSIEQHDNEEIDEIYYPFMINAHYVYNNLIKLGIPKEDARFVLPPAYWTHITMTVNARSLIHFLELRLAKGAQWEIRHLACKIFDEVYEIYPTLLEHLKDLRDKNNIGEQ